MSAADELIQSAHYRRMVEGFEQSCGLAMHAYNLEAVPLTPPFELPSYCQALHQGLDCPLYFDARYHHAEAPELRETCAGLGHVVVPVMDAERVQVANLVSDPCRFGPIDLEQLTEKAFKLKVFPDDLIAQAESVPLVPRDRALMAAEVLFGGLHEAGSGATDQGRVLQLITHHVAAAAADDVPDAILVAALEHTDSDWAYITLVDDDGDSIAEAASIEPDNALWPVLKGMGRWVTSTGEGVEVPSIADSSWSRHLAGGKASPGGLAATPLRAHGGVYGAIVVGGRDSAAVPSWGGSLAVFAEAGGDALYIARRLVATSGGTMLDATGAYNLRFLTELLEKEISRSGRHHHDLSLVMIHLANYGEVLGGLGRAAAEDAIHQMVQLIRSRTRKVNTLARVSDTDFCLVVPEAGSDIAERIAHELRSLAQAGSYQVQVNGGHKQIKVSVQTRTVSNPAAVDAALLDIVPGAA